MIQHDKLMHYTVGSMIALAATVVVGVWALVPVLMAAVGKEVYDKVSGKGTPELMDIVWTMWGGGVVVLAYLVGNMV